MRRRTITVSFSARAKHILGEKILKGIIVLMVTAVTVSIDSFAAGFSLSLNKKNNSLLPIAVTIVTLALCIITSLLGTLLKDYLDEKVDIFGATILVILAIINLLKEDDEQSASLQQITIAESLAMGFAVGTDAAVANLSLAIDGYGGIAPLLFAVMHYAAVYAGQRLADKITIKHANALSAGVLILLAIIKLV